MREIKQGKIRAGDYVLHLPSGETWVVCGVDAARDELIPCGYPFPTLAKLHDCVLLERKNGQTEEMRRALRKHGFLAMIEPEEKPLEKAQPPSTGREEEF